MIRKIRVFLVDDEPLARVHLASLLAAHPEVEVVGEAGDVETAAVLCARFLPDVVFLEVQLPGGDGFELLPQLVGRPAIVFVTGSGQFAVRAFAENASDYVLKPIHPDRLALTLDRLASRAPVPTGIPDEEELVVLREDHSLSRVPIVSITHIHSDGNYTSVYRSDSAPVLVRRSLAEWERQLPRQAFLRVDRSLIVCLAAVKSLEVLTRERSQLVMIGREEVISIGRAALLRLQHAMGNP
jgi:two-component system LytT family response regulator